MSEQEQPFRIRPAVVADAPALATLAAQTFTEAFGDQNTPEDLRKHIDTTYQPVMISAEIMDPGNHYFVADAEGVLIGYAKISTGTAPPEAITGENPLQLSRIYVLDAWIGRRVGAALMQTCLDAAKESGYDVVWLTVWEHNPRGIAFYERWGFRTVGTTTFVVGDDPQTDNLMQLTLTKEP